MTDDWYARLQASGLLDTLAPYAPVLVGAYPLGMAAPGSRIEIVCRATDLPAFARTLERTYGGDGFALYPGRLSLEDAVFAEFDLDGLPLEVAAQSDHEHRKLGAATIGISRVLEMEGDVSRNRLAARVAGGEDWLEAAMNQTGLTRSALEALATANAAVARRVLGVRTPGPSIREYLLPLLVGFLSEFLIILATSSGHSQDFTGLMLLVQAMVLGAVFGARMGLIAALAPLLLFGAVIGSSFLVGNESCGSDGCSYQFASYTFVALLVGSGAGVSGLLRDRYFPRAKSVDCAFAVKRRTHPCLKLDQHSVRPESAEDCPTRRSRKAPRSGPDTSVPSRTRTSACCPEPPTARASCAPTPTTWGWTGICSSTSSTRATTTPATTTTARSTRPRAARRRATGARPASS